MIQNKYSCTHTTRACQLFRLSLSPSPHPPNSFPSMLFSRDGKKRREEGGGAKKTESKPAHALFTRLRDVLAAVEKKKEKPSRWPKGARPGRAGSRDLRGASRARGVLFNARLGSQSHQPSRGLSRSSFSLIVGGGRDLGQRGAQILAEGGRAGPS
jgi:hypothetical protein